MVDDSARALGLVERFEEIARFEAIASLDGHKQTAALKRAAQPLALEARFEIEKPLHEGRMQEVARLDLIISPDLEGLFELRILKPHLL